MHEPASRFLRSAPRPRRRRVRAVAILPTLLTLANGICGFLAMVDVAAGMSAEGADAAGRFHRAGWLILLAMVFDALDGKVARMTRTASSFGAQLDSLCDFLTFGAAPAFLIHGLCMQEGWPFEERAVLVVSIFYFCCAATRLARFNVETGLAEEFHREFSGLPSPAAAGVIAAAVIPWAALEARMDVAQRVNDLLRHGLPIIAFILGVLMVSRIPYPHILNRLFRGSRPFVTLVQLSVVVLLGAIFYEAALFLAFLGYSVLGPVTWARARLARRPVTAAQKEPETSSGDSLF